MDFDHPQVDKFRYFFRDNEFAVQFCMHLSFVVHLWDDLIDQDKEIEPEDINTAFWLLFSVIPRNPFYVEFQEQLMPLLERVILQWHDANILERGTSHERHLAYGLRSFLIQVYHHVAYLCGGYGWIREVGPEIQRLNEYDLNEFLSEMEQWDAEL